MPPKKSGRGRKKASDLVESIDATGDGSVLVLKNGKESSVEANGDVVGEEAAVPKAVGKKYKPKATKATGSSDQLNGEAADPEHFKNENNLDVNEESSKKRGVRRMASKSVANTEQEAKIKAGRNAMANKPDRKEEDQPTSQKDSLAKEAAPEKRKRNARRRSSSGENPLSEDEADEQENKESQSEKKQSADMKSVGDKDGAPKKTRGRPAKVPTEESHKTKIAKQSTVDVPEMTSSLVDAEPKAMSSKGIRGRKRKNVHADKETEEVSEMESSKVDIENRIVKVSLLRQKNVDDMALEEMKKSEGKVKAAAGMSKKRGKRGREDDGDGEKPVKVSKASSSKLPKSKIPDVSHLDFANTSKTSSGESWNLKIVSWNINGIRAWLEKDGASYLHHEQPDVVCFQETKCPESKLPKEANIQGYHSYWLGGDKDGYSGVGMLSKKKPLTVEYGIGMEEHDKEGRVITADFDRFYLVAAYVPNAGRGLVRLDYRKQWDLDFRSYLRKLDQSKPVVLCGDLNVAHQEIDLANPKTNKKNAGFTQEERDGFSALLSEGFVDTYRHLYPDTTSVYTFWTYMMNARAKNVGWRIDYFVMSERFADRLCDCCVRKDVMGSDHCPLVLFLCI